MQNTLSATEPENACSGRYVDPNVPWAPSPRPQQYPEFNPYENESTNAVDHQHRPEGPVIPISWGLEVSFASDDGSRTATSLRGVCLAHNPKAPCDPFSRKRKRWSLMKKLKRYLGKRKRVFQEKENWMLLPSSSSRPHFSGQQPASSHAAREGIPLSAWREYGYWARPAIGGVEVRNNDSPPPDHVLREVDADGVFRSLRGDSGSPHPENWVPGLSHPSLPPKPRYWRTPEINEISPAPWECQLNPFLEHTRAGLPMLCFDIRLGEESIIFETGDVRHVPVSNSNLYQPATHPFVTEMLISAVADDPFPVFPWPVLVRNPRGVLCVDVFRAVHKNFQAYLTKAEVSKFSAFKLRMVEEACSQRRESRLMGREWNDDEDGLRRVDYLVDRVMFRGLDASTIGGGSWVLHLGPPGPEEKFDGPYMPPPLERCPTPF